jgi:hypothetical protein
MRGNAMRLLAGAGFVALATAAGAPAYADDATTGGGSGMVVIAPTPDRDHTVTAPVFSRAWETDQVQQMAQQLQSNTGARFPGEDALGTGTSITH